MKKFARVLLAIVGVALAAAVLTTPASSKAIDVTTRWETIDTVSSTTVAGAAVNLTPIRQYSKYKFVRFRGVVTITSADTSDYAFMFVSYNDAAGATALDVAGTSAGRSEFVRTGAFAGVVTGSFYLALDLGPGIYHEGPTAGVTAGGLLRTMWGRAPGPYARLVQWHGGTDATSIQVTGIVEGLRG